MKLCSLKLENFRQFYGKQQINFSDNAQNITVVLGENGNGKTGIFRAIIFCLFGEKELPKDGLDRDKEVDAVHLVNLNCLQEKPGDPIEARVELIFTNGSKKYFLERSVFDVMDAKSKTVRPNLEISVKLSIQNENGNVESVVNKEAEVANVISGIISSRVKDLFFFDGDKIETLSTANKDSRKEIKKGIMSLLQIDSIEKAIEITNRLKEDQHRVVKNKADTKLKTKEEELEARKNVLEQDKERLDDKKRELERVRTNVLEYEREQQENQQISDLYGQRKNLLESKKKTEKILEDMRISIDNTVSRVGHSLLSESTLLHTRSFVEQEERNNDYHSGITADLIDEILSSQKCICARPFDIGDETYLRLQEMKRKYEKMKLSDFIRDFKRSMKSALALGDNVDVKMQADLRDYFDQIGELEKLRKSLDDIECRISEFSQKEERLQGIDKSLTSCKEDAESLNRAIGMLDGNITRTEQEIDTWEQEVRELRKRDKDLKRDNGVLEYYEELNSLFASIRDAYSGKMRARLSQEATGIFGKLISEKDKRVLNQIIINEHYEIQAKGWNDISIFQDISSGQKQMLSLSFVAALARVAAGGSGNVIDMPLFMDTPFAKLDGNNRDNLIMTMPELTSQWILLVTDTEFARSEVNQMKATQRWGKFYRLDKICDGYTKIISIDDISDFAANR